MITPQAMKISKAMSDAIANAKARETEFWKRHKIEDEDDVDSTGIASEAHRAWVKAVELEYAAAAPESGRSHLDMPIARKAFILGFRMAKRSESE